MSDIEEIRKFSFRIQTELKSVNSLIKNMFVIKITAVTVYAKIHALQEKLNSEQ